MITTVATATTATATTATATTATATTATATTATATTATAATTLSGIAINFQTSGMLAVLFLITLLVIKELIGPGISTGASPSLLNLDKTIDISLASLLPVFAIIVIYKVLLVI